MNIVPRRRPRGTKPNPELRELAVEACPRVSIEPPDLVHVTSVGWGRRILDSGILEKMECRVFDKELVYTFLARPAYRFKRGAEKNQRINFFPFAIVISPDDLPAPYHVYPFDTGAYMAGIYNEALDPSIFLEDYELDPTLEAALRHIEWGFGTTEAYFDAKLKNGLEGSLPAWRSVAQSWLDIAALASFGNDKPDGRASAIELAFSKPIDLRQGHGKLVIFPQQFLEDPKGTNTEFQNRIKELNIPIATYEWLPNSTPDSYANQIADVVQQHIREASRP